MKRLDAIRMVVTMVSAATLRVEAGDDSATARLVRIDDSPGGEVEHGIETERHGQDGRSREAEFERFGTFELRHGADDPGTGGCPAGFELDSSDGACKPHGGGAAPAPAPAPAPGVCPAGWELDALDGVCEPHGGGT